MPAPEAIDDGDYQHANARHGRDDHGEDDGQQERDVNKGVVGGVLRVLCASGSRVQNCAEMRPAFVYKGGGWVCKVQGCGGALCEAPRLVHGLTHQYRFSEHTCCPCQPTSPAAAGGCSRRKPKQPNSSNLGPSTPRI